MLSPNLNFGEALPSSYCRGEENLGLLSCLLFPSLPVSQSISKSHWLGFRSSFPMRSLHPSLLPSPGVRHNLVCCGDFLLCSRPLRGGRNPFILLFCSFLRKLGPSIVTKFFMVPNSSPFFFLGSLGWEDPLLCSSPTYPYLSPQDHFVFALHLETFSPLVANSCLMLIFQNLHSTVLYFAPHS